MSGSAIDGAVVTKPGSMPLENACGAFEQHVLQLHAPSTPRLVSWSDDLIAILAKQVPLCDC